MCICICIPLLLLNETFFFFSNYLDLLSVTYADKRSYEMPYNIFVIDVEH